MIDTSAVLAILQDEPDCRAFNEAIEATESRMMSVASYVEISPDETVSTVQEPFRRSSFVRWSDLDSLAHMANTAYLAAVVDVRFAYFVDRGFPLSEFARLRIGPVVQRDEVEYYRELRLHDPYEVTFLAGGLAPDASRMKLVNEFVRPDGQRVARVVSHGGWMDLVERKLVAPPDPLRAVLETLLRTEDFEVLKAVVPPRARRDA